MLYFHCLSDYQDITGKWDSGDIFFIFAVYAGHRIAAGAAIRYAPKHKLLGLLHRQVGQDYANKVIFPEIASVLREVIGTMEAEHIYTTGREVIVAAINLAIERVAQRYKYPCIKFQV